MEYNSHADAVWTVSDLFKMGVRGVICEFSVNNWEPGYLEDIEIDTADTSQKDKDTKEKVILVYVQYL